MNKKVSKSRHLAKAVTWRIKEGFEYGDEYIIMEVPNIVDISYGRGVGYTFTQHDLGEEMHQISATKIRAQLRAEGKL